MKLPLPTTATLVIGLTVGWLCGDRQQRNDQVLALLREEVVKVDYSDLTSGLNSNQVDLIAFQAEADEAPPTRWNQNQRPLRSAFRRGHFSWTGDDGLAPDIIGLLATGPEMLSQLFEERPSVRKRQLVYHDHAFVGKIDDVIAGWIKRLPLPLFDGEQSQIDITHVIKIGPDDYRLIGHITGERDDSFVQIVKVATEISADLYRADRTLTYRPRLLGSWILNELTTAPTDHHLESGPFAAVVPQAELTPVEEKQAF